MNPLLNPYSPGAGSRPPELAGRDAVRHEVAVALSRIRLQRSAKSLILVGLRGVGKTVLLDQLRTDAGAAGIYTVRMETPEDRSLPALLAPRLKDMLLRLSRVEAARDLATRAIRGLTGFARGLKVKYHDIELAMEEQAEAGLADNGDLEGDLSELLAAVGQAAQSAGTAVVLFIDEMQYLERKQFAALISALHRCAQDRLPVTLVGAGLPQLRALAGDAKSYAERLFEFPLIGALNVREATEAIVKPAEAEGVMFTAAALERITTETRGYPYFLQEWGKQCWNNALESPIQLSDVESASRQVMAALDVSFFQVRLDRLTPAEKRYLRGMAELGAGPHRSGVIAAMLNKPTNSLGPVRQTLITKGMIWSPSHGDTAYTVPLFDEFMKRIMPGDEWKTL